MSLLRLFAGERGDGAARGRLLAAAAVSGLANGFFIAVINAGAAHAANDEFKAELIAAGLFSIALYAGLQYYALRQAVAAAEAALLRVRLRVIGKVARARLRFIEAQAGAGTFLPLTEDAGLISEGALTLAAAAQGALVVVFAALYLAWLSPATLLLSLVLYGALLPVATARQQRVRRELGGAAVADARFFTQFSGLLAGFKELKLNRPANDALYADLCRSTRRAFRLKRDAGRRLAQSIAFGYAVPVLVVFAGVFVVPTLVPEASATVHQIVATILFMNAPLGVLVNAAPLIARIDAALGRIDALERQVDAAAEPAGPAGLVDPAGLADPAGLVDPAGLATAPGWRPGPVAAGVGPGAGAGFGPRVGAGVGVGGTGFERIELRAVGFRYLDPDGQPLFEVGPLDLELCAGELLFIVGGNGSGKSTLLKLLTGLYPPDQGEVRRDGRRVGHADLAAYRSLFTTVFTDFHLLRRLYGLPHLDPAEVNRCLAELDIADKTRYTPAGFSTLELSTGQKKRLAIASALLKGRPICVFDEPAADQDPDFRRRFYDELLPGMRAGGRTLVVVSHDDRYFHVADRVLQMRDGALERVAAGRGPMTGRAAGEPF